LTLFISGTQDARGYRQWREVGRHVKKGAKAIYILAPLLRKKADKEDKTEDYYLIGFISVPVFRVEDTEGEPLDYQKIEFDFPLMDRAKEWGLDILAVSGGQDYYGAYTGKEIRMATQEEIVFFHELAHHSHKLVLGQLKGGQDWKQEIVAELSAQALCYLYGAKPETHLGNTYNYIERYAKESQPPMTPITACLQVLGEVEQVLSLIIKGGGEEKENGQIRQVARAI